MPAKPTHVALLRGINVGGHHRMPMKELRALLTGTVGLEAVKTYIQSGNVVFAARGTDAELQQRLGDAITARFGFSVPVVVRTADDYRAVIERHPFAEEADHHPKFVMVGFLADEPSAAAVEALDPPVADGDKWAVREREVYLWLPAGAGRSKMRPAYFDRALDTAMTVRNWRSVHKIADLLTV